MLLPCIACIECSWELWLGPRRLQTPEKFKTLNELHVSFVEKKVLENF